MRPSSLALFAAALAALATLPGCDEGQGHAQQPVADAARPAYTPDRRSEMEVVYQRWRGSVLLTSLHSPSSKERPEFDDAEHQPFLAKGEAVIEGQAFMNTRGGIVRYSSGDWVIVMPGTKYGDHIAKEILEFDKTELVRGVDSLFLATMRVLRGDAEGRFAINGLPSGRWLVMARTRWHAAGEEQGGWHGIEVEIESPAVHKVILAR